MVAVALLMTPTGAFGDPGAVGAPRLSLVGVTPARSLERLVASKRGSASETHFVAPPSPEVVPSPVAGASSSTLGSADDYNKGVKAELAKATAPLRLEIARRETWGKRFDRWALALIERVFPRSGNTRRIDYVALGKELKPLVPVLPTEEEIGVLIAAGDKKVTAALACREDTAECGRAHTAVAVSTASLVAQLMFRGKRVFAPAREGASGRGPKGQGANARNGDDPDIASSNRRLELAVIAYRDLIRGLHDSPFDARARADAFALGAERISKQSGGRWSIKDSGRSGNTYWFEGGEGEVLVVLPDGTLNRGGSDTTLTRQGGAVSVNRSALVRLLTPGPSDKMLEEALEVVNQSNARGTGRLELTEQLLRQIPSMHGVEPHFRREPGMVVWSGPHHRVLLASDGTLMMAGP